MTTDTAPDLRIRWKELQREEPKTRIRDAAAKLGVSEAELLATRCGEDGVTRLQGPWQELIKALPAVGHVMCLTRNEAAVHERHGIYRHVEFFGGPVGMGQVVGPDIDLRLFLSHWHLGFAVIDETEEGMRRSLHFFDQDGTAVHKVFLQPSGDAAAFDRIVESHTHEDQSGNISVLPLPPKPADKPGDQIDVAGFRSAWSELKDTHEFFGLLKRFGVGRLQALRLADPAFARRTRLEAFRAALEKAASNATPIMIFVGSTGCIQIHTGPVTTLKPFGPWFNVLDPEFNLHLREDLIAEAWIVRKPTRDGVVTSIELYDSAGENVLLLFGKRKPGEAEDPAWRDILASVEAES